MPLEWVLKHPPADWKIASKGYGATKVLVGKNPPNWK